MDFNRIVQSLAQSGAVSGFAGGLAGSALVGAVSGKKGRKMAKGALKVGALAAVGGLAYSAYRRYRQNNPQLPVPAGGQAAEVAGVPGRWDGLSERRFDAAATGDSNAMLIIRAMIAAASADGHFDRKERDRVFVEAQRLGLTGPEKAMLFDEMQNPASLPEIAAEIRCAELAIEVYAASALAADETEAASGQWLSSLALALDLPQDLVQSIHEEVIATRHSEEIAA